MLISSSSFNERDGLKASSSSVGVWSEAMLSPLTLLRSNSDGYYRFILHSTVFGFIVATAESYFNDLLMLLDYSTWSTEFSLIIIYDFKPSGSNDTNYIALSPAAMPLSVLVSFNLDKSPADGVTMALSSSKQGWNLEEAGISRLF